MVDKIEEQIQNCCKCSCISGVSLDKPKIFCKGTCPKVMIIGHSPTVRTKTKAKVVLQMDNDKGKLYKYIHNDIMEPLGIDSEDLYCTNLIKCFTQELPEDANKKDKMYINKIFDNCCELLEKEIEIIKPKLIISLSERVFKILSEKYMGEKLKFKEHFGKLHTLNIANMSIQYLPVIHIPKSEKVKMYYQEQPERLSSIRSSLNFLENK